MEQSTVSGLYYSSGASSVKCALRVTSAGIEITVDGAGKGVMLYSKTAVILSGVDDRFIKFEADVEGEKVSVLTSDFAVMDMVGPSGAPEDFVERLQRLRKNKKSRGKWRRAALPIFAIAIVLLVVGIWYAFVPAVDAVVGYIPVEWESELGKNQANNIVQSNQVCTDEDLQRAVLQMSRTLVGSMQGTSYNWKVTVIDADEINAFALPGGYIFINRALIEAADSPEEVAGVLAHEMQHVARRHGLRNVVSAMGRRVVLYALLGDVEAVEGFIVENVASLADMGFSREQETEADTLGVDLLYDAGVGAGGLVDFMARQQAAAPSVDGALSMFSTHPGWDNRLDDLKARMSNRDAARGIALDADWSRLRKSCAPAQMNSLEDL